MLDHILDNIFLYIAIFIALDFLIVFFVVFRKKKLKPAQKKKFLQIYQDIESHPIDKQILEYDKLLEKVLQARGYKGSLGAILKLHPKLFGNFDALWKAHKLRNTIAHEIDYKIGDSEGRSAIRVFQSNINMLINL